jgi:outer membrane protein OmpA-like peptidoglycan-associated protein
MDATRAGRLTFGSLAVVLALTGCAGRSWQFWKTASPEAPKPAVAGAPAPVTARPASPAVVTVTPAPATQTPAASAPAFTEFPVLADVRFKAGLVTVGKADATALDEVVRWLRANPGAQVRIEGHTDDRGTSVENLAVGQQRAASVMKYLVSKGLDPDRISIISYGSDRPVCAEKTDACRAKNRRAHFLVKQP